MGSWLPCSFRRAVVDRIGGIATWLAEERGRDTVPWFFLGALLGLLAIFMLGFSERVPGGRFKASVECQEVIPRLATTCPRWQTDLIEAGGMVRRTPKGQPPA